VADYEVSLKYSSSDSDCLLLDSEDLTKIIGFKAKGSQMQKRQRIHGR
jgi:hypothetical protein